MPFYRNVLGATNDVIEQLQVPRRSHRQLVHENKTKIWVGESVWRLVIAVDLGLIEDSPTATNDSRKPQIRGRNPGRIGKHPTRNRRASKAIDSISDVRVNNRSIKLEDSHQQRFISEHRYSFPASSRFPEQFDGSNVRNDSVELHRDEEKTPSTKETRVYNHLNALRNISQKRNIYEYNRGIKNQTGPRHVRDHGIDRPDASLDDSSRGANEILQNSSRRHEKPARTRTIETHNADNQKNPYAKGLDEPPRKKVPADEATNREIDYDDSEIDESLMVDPSRDLHRALVSTEDRANDIVNLSPGLNVSLDLNFEATSFTKSLDSLARESLTTYRDEEMNSEGADNESERSDERCNEKSYRMRRVKRTASTPDEKTLDAIHNEYNKRVDCSIGNIFKSKRHVWKSRKTSSTLRLAKRRSADSMVTESIEDKENINVNIGIRVTRGSTRNGVSKVNDIETSYTTGTVVWGNCTGWWPGLVVDAEDVGMCFTEGKSWIYWIGEHRISELRNGTQVQPFSTGLRARMIETLKTKSRKDEDYGACVATIELLNDELLDTGPLTQPYHVWVERHLMRLESIDRMILYPYPSNIRRRLDELKNENSKITKEYLSDLKCSTENRSTISKTIGVPKSAVKQATVVTDPSHLPLMNQKPGVITWAKIMGQKWWPAMIIDYRDCGMKEPSFGCQWILWYGDDTFSQVNHRFFLDFAKGIVRMKDYVLTCRSDVYRRGVLDAAKDFCASYGCGTDSWTFTDVFQWFDGVDGVETAALSSSPEINGSGEKSQKYPTRILEGLKKHKGNCTVAAIREHNIKDSEDLRVVMSGKEDVKDFCLMCLARIDDGDNKTEHPFFVGHLCEECTEKYVPTIFAYGDDGKCFFCTVCAGSDTVVICDSSECPRVYCTACLKYLIAPRAYDEIMLNDPWICFLCEDLTNSLSGGLLKPRKDWKDHVAGLFRSNHDSVPNRVEHYADGKRKIRVLSLFDGISAGLVVLKKLGIEVDVYYASEIDPHAEMVSSAHFGSTIVRLGDVRAISEKMIRDIAPIDLLIGGSPCNDLSLVNPMRLGLHDPNGTGVLFFEYCRIKNLIRDANVDKHFFWLFENVASMPSKYRSEINEYLGREPDLIDSSNYSPQHRPRLYWSNLPSVSYPTSSQDLQDVLTPNCNRHALVKKIRTVTTRGNSLKQGKHCLRPILMNDDTDSVWITELEEIFGFPRHYTDIKNLSATKRQKLIGMSWSVQTVTEIMRPLCNFFETRNVETEKKLLS